MGRFHGNQIIILEADSLHLVLGSQWTFMDGLGTAPMFNDYLLLNVVTLSLQVHLEHQGAGSLSHLVSFSGDYIFPLLQHLEILGGLIFLCHHHSCILTQKSLCLTVFTFLVYL